MLLNRVSSGPLMMPAGTGSGASAGAGDPNPNPGAVAFDPAAFESRMAELFNKGINALDKKINALEAKIPRPPDPANPNPVGGDPANPNPADPAPHQEPPKTLNSAELTLKLTSLEKVLQNEQKLRQAAEKQAQEEKAHVVEEKRKSAFMESIANLEFANPKARQQFIDAYLAKVKVDDTGAHVVETDAGPVGVQQFMQSEFDASPHFAAPGGRGGAGATAGAKVSGGNRMPDILNMNSSQVLAIPQAQRDSMLTELATAWNLGA